METTDTEKPAEVEQALPIEESETLNDLPVTKPEIEPPEKQEPKKRGRKPFPRDANGNIIRPDGSIKPAPGNSRRAALPAGALNGLTDEMVGDIIGGVFMLSGTVMGPHMRLTHRETVKVGAAFGPLARELPETFATVLKILTVLPVSAEIVGPRLAVSTAVWRKQIPKQEARKALLATFAMIEAEKQLDLSSMAEDAKEELEAIAKASMQMQAQVHSENKKNGVG